MKAKASAFTASSAQPPRVELERCQAGPALHRSAYAWHRDHGTTGEAIRHAIEAGAYAEGAELIQGPWISYANTYRYDTVRPGRGGSDQILSGNVHLLLVQAWVLSLSARREEAARAIAAAERLGDLGAGPLPDGFSSAEASLTMLRACFPWGDVGAQLENGRRAAELEGPGSPWRPLACWAVGMGLYFQGEPDQADRWFAESAALAPANAQWLAGEASLAYRSWIAASGAVLTNSGCWPKRQPNSCGSTAPRRSSARLRWRWEYRSRRAAGPGRHCR